MKIWVDSISGRKCARGVTDNGASFEIVQYGEKVQVGLCSKAGTYFTPFMEHCTVEEMVARLGGYYGETVAS